MCILPLIGRILFSLIFFLKGIDHFTSKSIDFGAQMGVPAAEFLVPLFGVIALAGSICILLGYKAKLGAWLLILFLIPTTFFMHKFWQFDDSYQALMNHLCFFKNISMIGACLFLAYFGSGPLSLSCSQNKTQ